MRYLRYITIGIILCAILAVVELMTPVHLMRKVQTNELIIGQLSFDLFFYLLIYTLYSDFKSKVSFALMLLCWVSVDFISYSGVSFGYKKHLWLSLFNLFTCTFMLLQYKHNVSAAKCFAIMASLQLFMVLNWFHGHNQTILYLNYHYIVAGINILTISTLIRWDGLLRIRANIIYHIGIICINIRYAFARRFYI